MTWNIEGLKQHQFVLADVLLSHLPDIVFLSEPLVFQTDIQSCLNTVQHEYCHSLNSSDLYDRDLPILKSRVIGGTLALRRRQLDPHLASSRRNDTTCLNFADCFVGVWKMLENCLEGARQVSYRCLEGVWRVSGRCLKGLEGAWRVS